MLYPVYLLVQATRFAGQQLQQAAQQHSPQLPPPGKSTNKTPPEADRPIQQVLQAVATWELAAVKNGKESSSLTLNSQLSFPIPNPDGDLQNLPDLQNCLPPFPIPNIEIQGVAALIETRSLVLVTTENQILDILNPQQQQKLQQQIILEVAEYWHQWRIFLSFGQGFKAKLQPPPATRSRVLPPVRFFWSMMAWVQRGQVAIAANLFQESTLVKTGHGEASNQSFNSESTNYNLPLSTFILDQLEVLDRAIAELETNPLRPGEELTKAIAHRTQELLQGWGIGNNPLQPTEENESLETNRVKIWDLMQAAIAHFFGKGNEKLIEPDFPEPSAISASTPIEALPSDNSAALSTVPSANLKSTSSSPRSPAVNRFVQVLMSRCSVMWNHR